MKESRKNLFIKIYKIAINIAPVTDNNIPEYCIDVNFSWKINLPVNANVTGNNAIIEPASIIIPSCIDSAYKTLPVPSSSPASIDENSNADAIFVLFTLLIFTFALILFTIDGKLNNKSTEKKPIILASNNGTGDACSDNIANVNGI